MRIVGFPSSRGWRGCITAAGAAVIALTGSACGGSATPSTRSTPKKPRPSQVSSLVASIPSAVSGIAPMNTIFQQDVYVLHLVGGTLFAFVPGRSTAAVPALAQSGSLSGDGTTATIKLKSGLKFSDGSPLTSADVVGTFRHDLSETKSAGASFFANVASVSAPNALTVVIRFRTPDPQYKDDLALFTFAIVPDGSWKKRDFATALVSAGPYVVKGPLTGNRVVLTRNPDYAGPKPAVAKLTFEVIEDPSATLNELESGEIDFDSSLPPVNVATLPKSLTAGKVEPWLIAVLSFGRSSLLSNVRIRKAVGFALNRTQLSTASYDGQAEPWGSEFSPNFNLSATDFPPPFPQTADVAKAKQLLQGTACASGCSFSVNVIAGSTDDSAATAAQQQLAKVGIKLNVVPLDGNTYNQRNFTGDFQSLIADGGAFTGSAAMNLLLNPAGPTGGMFSRYTSAAMAAAVARANSTIGTGSQTVAFRKVAQLYQKSVPWVPLTTSPFIWATDKKATGKLFFSPTGLPDVAFLPR